MGLFSTPRDNLTATTDPNGATDNLSTGYGAGSTWINQLSNVQWSCLKSDEVSAVWQTAVKKTSTTGALQSSWKPDVSGPTEMLVSNVTVYDLIDGVTSGVVSTLRFPTQGDASVNPTLCVDLITTKAAGAGSVRLEVNVSYVANGETLSSAGSSQTLFFTQPITDKVGALTQLGIVLNAALLDTADLIVIHLERLGGDGADSYPGNVGVTTDCIFEYEPS